MNFLAHYVVATRSLTPMPPLSAYVMGTALPDLLPLAEKRARLRQARIAETIPCSQLEPALSAGVLVHLATDAAFHKSTAFAQAQAEVSRIVDEAGFDGMRVRRFFVSHVLTELALDAVLLRADTTLADGFYEAFAPESFADVTHWAEQVTGHSLPHLPEVLTRFASSRYLRHYINDEGVATGLSHLCRRARQATFDGMNFDRLIGTVEKVMALLPKYVPALLSETAAGVLSSMQEEAYTTANVRAEAHVMAGTHFSPIAIALFAAFFAFMLYRRYRRTVGRQPLNPRRLLFQVSLLGLFTVLFLIPALGSITGAAASIGGLIAGGLIGLAGLRLTRFERTPERDYFTPNLYLGLAVFGLFLGRLAYRMMQVSAQVQTLTAGGQAPPNLSGFTSNPLTSALLLMVFGYYLIYEGGLLLWVRRNPPTQAALLTKEGTL